MKISTKIQYGLRFLMRLANAQDGELIKLNEVTQRQQIPGKYLENIVAQIKSQGLIDVKRGAQGGYKLSRSANEITLKEIFEVLDGDTLAFEKEEKAGADTPNYAVFSSFIGDFKEQVDTFLEDITLADLAAKVKNQQDNQMFYI